MATLAKGWKCYTKFSKEIKLLVTIRMIDRLRSLNFKRQSEYNVFLRQAIDEKLAREGR